MNVFRRQLKRISVLALLALGIQFGLSFGHFHAPAAASEYVQFRAANTHGAPESTADICDICAVVTMAQNALDASAPVVAAPDAITRVVTPLAPVEFRVEERRAAFQSRAPPRS